MPEIGLQLKTRSIHCIGIALRPWTAPKRAPAMAAFVSVSPPTTTVPAECHAPVLLDASPVSVTIPKLACR